MRPPVWCLMFLLVGAVGCQTVQTTQPGAVGVERKQRMLIVSLSGLAALPLAPPVGPDV